MVSEKIARTIPFVAAGSALLGLIIMVAAAPWTPALGPSLSPARIALGYTVSIFLLLIPALLLLVLFIQRQDWLAPPGRYMPEVKYKPLSTYQLTATAIAAAVYAVGGFPTGVNIDLPALICSFTAVFFGAVPAFIAFFIGFFIRWAIGGAPWLALPVIGPLVAIIDASVWCINAYLFWSIVRRVAKPGIGLAIGATILMVLVHFSGWLLVYAFTMNPWPGFVGYLTFAMTTWYPTAIVFIIIGALIGETVYRARVAPPVKAS
ncbi:MAG: hypothetical protein QW265_03375 [Candidatus Bathyarchaeia archaeon]